MKKRRILLLFFALMFVSLTSVKASTCSDRRILELSSLANNVQVITEKTDRVISEYESETFGETSQDIYPGFYIAIYNLTKDLNVSVYREDTKKTAYASSKDANDEGIVYFDVGYATIPKNFTIKIRSNDSACKNEVLKVVSISTPMYNVNSQNDSCKDNADFNMCKEFTTVDYNNVTAAEFHEELLKYKEEKAKEEKRESSIFYNIARFIAKYRWIFITVAIIIGAYVVVYIINRKKSRLV